MSFTRSNPDTSRPLLLYPHALRLMLPPGLCNSEEMFLVM
jgi:hypothetical protein